MKKIFELLNDARQTLDGECNRHTPEYRAMDELAEALGHLAVKVREMDKSLYRMANEASCRASGR